MTSPRFTSPPRALSRPGVKFDNIALVPASLLPFKPRYQALARTLPRGTVLLVLPRQRPAYRKLLVNLAARFAARGHQIATRTAEEVARL
jgi:hypothetical protein